MLNFLHFYCFSLVNSLNILVWSPTYGQSHVNFMGNIANTLSFDGHNVTLLLVENDREVHVPFTIKGIPTVHYVSPLVGEDEWSELHYKRSNIFHLRGFELGDYLKMEDINYRTCQSILDDHNFLETLKMAKFDVMFVEIFHFCPAGIAHILKIPKNVLASALGMTSTHYELTNLPITLSNTPALLSGYSNGMSFMQRAYNVLHYYIEKWLLIRSLYLEQQLFNSRFVNFPDLKQLLKEKMDYILLNVNEFTDPVRPITPSVKYIGGANIYNPKPLPQELYCLLAGARNGVILFSLGSLVNTADMPQRLRRAFLEAFSHFRDYTVIWKDDLGSNSSIPNVHYRSWLPQVDLLADSRVKVFVTHGGMNSVHEALHFGVPMIILPIFADQDGNAVLAEERGYAVKLNKFSLTKGKIIDALMKILGDGDKESLYTMKARQAERILRGSPERMREDIRLVARTSSEEKKLTHLTITNDLSFFQYYNLDVYLLLLFISIAGVAFFLWLIDHIKYFPKRVKS